MTNATLHMTLNPGEAVTLYQRKPETVSAYQFKGPFPMHFMTSTGPATAQPGDWIVVLNGTRFAMSDAAFRSTYEQINEQQA